jgi:C4-dicarboxylate transporter DctQ subunit
MKSKTKFDRLLDYLAAVAGVMLAFAALSVSVQVFSRYFLGRPMGWLVEINEYILLHIAFLVAAWVLRQEGHVRMDIVLTQLKRKTQLRVEIATSILSIMVCIVLTFFGMKVTWDLYKTGHMTISVMEIPKCTITPIIFVGSFLLMIQFIRRTRGFLRALREMGNQE